MAIKNTSFAKGEAVQKLIEVIARVNNKSVSDDAALRSAIDEVREMFKTDEMTEDTFENITALQAAGGLEPGHMYKTEYSGSTCIAIADSNNSFLQFIFVDGEAALINWETMDIQFLREQSGVVVNLFFSSDLPSELPIPEYCSDYYAMIIGNASLEPHAINFITPTSWRSHNGACRVYVMLSGEGETVDVFCNGRTCDNNTVDVDSHAEFIIVYASDAIGNATSEFYRVIASTFENFIGTNAVTTVANIPVTKSTVVATLPAYSDVPVPVSFAEGLPEGREVYVIAQNASTDPLTLSFTDANVESIDFAPGQRVEFSVINVAGTYYTRVGVDATAADVEEISAEEVAAKFA